MPLKIPTSGPLKGHKLIVDYGPKLPMMTYHQQLKPLSHDAPAESWAKPLQKKR
jgi:hypothetical protein